MIVIETDLIIWRATTITIGLHPWTSILLHHQDIIIPKHAKSLQNISKVLFLQNLQNISKVIFLQNLQNILSALQMFIWKEQLGKQNENLQFRKLAKSGLGFQQKKTLKEENFKLNPILVNQVEIDSFRIWKD